MSDVLRFKRGNKAQLPALMQGEPGFCLDEGRLYVGGNAGNVCVSVSSGSQVTMSSGKDLQTDWNALISSANVTYYVRTDGSDTNNGLSDTALGAFRTVGKAISMIPWIVNHTITINVGAGDYSGEGTIFITGHSGGGTINFYGDTVVSDNVVLSRLSMNRNSCTLTVRGFKVKGLTASAISASLVTNVTITYCKVTDVAAYDGIAIMNGSSAYIGQCVFSNRDTGIRCVTALTHSDGNSGTTNTYGLVSLGGGTIGKNGTQPAGTTAEYGSTGGVIR